MDADIQEVGPSGPSRTTNGTTTGSSRQASTNSPSKHPQQGQNTNASKTGVVQPKPQALPKRTGPSSIIVSPRQKGNPILSAIKSMPWEYGDIPADYVLGLTTCALFLSLKYHRIHPEYIYSRMKGLQGRYLLRIVLVLVDIQNHEESLRELSKTSLVNGVTIVLCWSSAEGARYLELFKTYENAAPTAIRQHQSTAYADRMVDFITTPRSINKTDAVSLVSQFGTVRTAVNARHEDVAGIAGWGEKKVQRWCASVREPFRVARAAKRHLDREESSRIQSLPVSRAGTLSRDVTRGSPAVEVEESRVNGAAENIDGLGEGDADQRPSTRVAEEAPVQESLFVEDEEALAEAMSGPAIPAKRTAGAEEPPRKKKKDDDPVNEGVMAVLSKLRKDGG